MDAKTFWHLNSHKYNTFWVANSKDDKITFEKSDDLWRYMNDFLEQSHKHGVVQVPQFEQILQVRLAELPYTKHLDDGQYNDGQAYGFECGARWAYEKLSSGTAVGNSAAGQSGSDGCRHRWWELADGKVLCDKCGVVKD